MAPLVPLPELLVLRFDFVAEMMCETDFCIEEMEFAWVWCWEEEEAETSLKMPRPWNGSVLVLVLILELMLPLPLALVLMLALLVYRPERSQLGLEPHEERESESLKVPEEDLLGPTEGLTSRFVFAKVFLTLFEIDLFNVMVGAVEGSLVAGRVICWNALCCACSFSEIVL